MCTVGRAPSPHPSPTHPTIGAQSRPRDSADQPATSTQPGLQLAGGGRRPGGGPAGTVPAMGHSASLAGSRRVFVRVLRVGVGSENVKSCGDHQRKRPAGWERGDGWGSPWRTRRSSRKCEAFEIAAQLRGSDRWGCAAPCCALRAFRCAHPLPWTAAPPAALRSTRQYEGKLAALTAINEALRSENEQLRDEVEAAGGPRTDAGGGQGAASRTGAGGRQSLNPVADARARHRSSRARRAKHAHSTRKARAATPLPPQRRRRPSCGRSLPAASASTSAPSTRCGTPTRGCRSRPRARRPRSGHARATWRRAARGWRRSWQRRRPRRPPRRARRGRWASS